MKLTKRQIVSRLSDPAMRARVEWLLSEPTLVVDGVGVAEAIVRPLLAGRETEALACVALDQRGRVIDSAVLSEGSHRYTVVDPVQVLRWVLTRSRPPATFIVAHNHPSGDPSPSSQDDAVTHKLKRAADTVGVKLTDHIIVGSGTMYSYAAHGRL